MQLSVPDEMIYLNCPLNEFWVTQNHGSLYEQLNTLKLTLFCLSYFQTDGSVPNTLVIANCEIVKPRVAAAEHISQVTITSLLQNVYHHLYVNLILLM